MVYPLLLELYTDYEPEVLSRAELASIEDYTIEHILPQGANLPE